MYEMLISFQVIPDPCFPAGLPGQHANPGMILHIPSIWSSPRIEADTRMMRPC